MVPNSAGGHAFPVDDMTRLHRFLILGSEGGSYYADERKLTLDNVKAVKRCITASEESGINAVTEIARISKSGRAPKPGPVLFALAMAASYGSDKVRQTAFDFLIDVARTGSHLQMFVGYIGTMRGWGRGLRRAVGNWYTQRPIEDAVYQAVKYRSRHNWTHRDLLRKSHPVGDGLWGDLFAWITHGTMPDADDRSFPLIRAYEEAKTATTARLSTLIRDNRLSWEMVPPEMLDKQMVWEALAQDMPMTALLRNLATLTRVGMIAPMDSAEVCESLKKIGTMSRIHPIAVLTALLVYKAGKGVRGKNTWTPAPQVIDALDAAFGRSFSQAPQTNKRLYLDIDVSGSMSNGEVAGVPGLSPRMAAAAMAMAIARREPNYYMAGFAASPGQDSMFAYVNRQIPVMSPLDITASDSISMAMQKARDLPFGRTDCALPMLDAMELNPNPPMDRDGRREDSGRGEGVTGAMIRARIWVDGRLAGGLQALLGAPMAAYSGCGERDGGIGHGKRRSRTGLARVCGDVGLAGGSVADGRRQAGSGMARSRARARLNCSSQGQRRGRCRVNRRAERVIRPAKAKTRRLRVLVVRLC